MSDLAPATATRDEAERLTERIRITATNYVEARDKLEALLREAQERQVHAALGFASWTAYLAATFADQPMVLPTAERREIVGLLAAEGMSTRDMAAIVGADHSTVSRDRKVLQDATPTAGVDEHTARARAAYLAGGGEVMLDTGEIAAALPRSITGHDGKTYTRPAAPPTTKRRPITDAYLDATFEVVKAVERLERLTADDRFPQNAEKVAQRNRGDLLRARDSLAGVIAVLNSSTGD